MNIRLFALILVLSALILPTTGCGNSSQADSAPKISLRTQITDAAVSHAEPHPQTIPGNSETNLIQEEPGKMKMHLLVNGQSFTASLEHNTAVDKLIQILEQGPVTLHLRDYAGFEKVGPLGQSLPTGNHQITTQPGDIMLYQGNQIVLFYGTNSWSYTALGHVDDLTGWQDALGGGDIEVVLSLP